jgi:hypothetical protein
MKQEVAEWMDRLVAERRRHGELAAVDHGARRDRVDAADVADRAAERVEQRRAALGGRGLGGLCAMRNSGGPSGRSVHVSAGAAATAAVSQRCDRCNPAFCDRTS